MQKPGVWDNFKPGPQALSEVSMSKVVRPPVDIDWGGLPSNDPRWHMSLPKHAVSMADVQPPHAVLALNAQSPRSVQRQPAPFLGNRVVPAGNLPVANILLPGYPGAEEVKHPGNARPGFPVRDRSPLPVPMVVEPARVDPDVYQIPKEDIKCIVCLDIYEVLLSDKSCGALLCEGCASRVRTCPNCRQLARFERNAYLDRLMSNIQIRCQCGQLIAKREIPAHKRVCTEDRILCPAAACRGAATMSKTEFDSHLTNVHKEEFMAAFVREFPTNFP